MSILVPLAAALLVSSAQIPLATQVQLPSGETVELAADFVAYEADKQVLTARGHCELRTGEMLLRADEVTYDEGGQVATASGNVMFVGPGGMAAVADSVRVDIRSFEANLQGGLFMQKRGVTQEAMLTAKTPQELRAMGETPVILSGTRIRRTGPNSFVVDDLAFTPCECGPGEPSWRVEASAANVVLGERATLSWPVVYVRSVPVFALPWLYLPLAERRSGLLIPSPRTNSLNGFSLEQPVFFTLGRSYDITLTPGYYTGGSDENHKVWDETRPEGPGEVEIREPRYNGVKGPRLLTEFRYAPSETMRGRATLGLLHDSRPRVDPRTFQFFRQRVDGRQISALVDAPRGLRGEASWQHTQELGDGWYDRVDASFVSDGNYTRDLTADIIAQAFQYLRSTGTVYRRQDDFYAGLDVALRQDIRWPYRFFQDNRVPAAADPERTDLKGPATFQRLPAITLSLPERPLAGGLTGSLRMEYVRLAPMMGGFGDEGIDGIFRNTGDYIPFGDDGWPYPLDETQANGVFDSLDREARDRVDFFPRLSTSLGLGKYARLTPSLALRQDVWAGERSGRTWQRGYPLAGLVLDSQLVRTWAGRESATYRHALSPSLELRYVPGGWGRVPGPGAQPPGEGLAQPYDEVDAAVPLRPDGRTRGFLHAVLAVDQTLRFKRGNEAREPLRLRIGQGFDLTRYAPAAGKGTDTGPVLRDTFARLSASAGVLNAGGILRFEPSSGRITQVGADFSVDNGKGTALYARYDDLLVASNEAIGRGVNPLSVGPDATRRGLDTLVGSASLDVPGITSTERAQTLIAGTRLRLGFGLGVRYEAIVQPLFLNTETQESQPLAQQVLGLSYGPACDCWRLEAVVTLRRGSKLEFSGASLSVAGFGNFGSGG